MRVPSKKILITGSSGFVAPFLGEKLTCDGHKVFYTSRSSHIKCDLLRFDAIDRIIKKIKPDAIVHLAGASQTSESAVSPKTYVENNVVATANLCEAYSRLPGKKTLLLVSSGMVYGSGHGQFVFSENSVAKPTTPYGLSKLAAEQLAQIYNSKNLKVYIVRPFNHIGPHQKKHFVSAAFAQRIQQAKSGDVIKVGGLNAWRDFTDVRDIVAAYALIIVCQPEQRLFVLGSGRLTKIESVLRTLIKISGKKIRFKVQDKLSTSRSISKLGASPSLAKTVLGWTPRISLDQSLKDLYWS